MRIGSNIPLFEYDACSQGRPWLVFCGYFVVFHPVCVNDYVWIKNTDFDMGVLMVLQLSFDGERCWLPLFRCVKFEVKFMVNIKYFRDKTREQQRVLKLQSAENKKSKPMARPPRVREYWIYQIGLFFILYLGCVRLK